MLIDPGAKQAQWGLHMRHTVIESFHDGSGRAHYERNAPITEDRFELAGRALQHRMRTMPTMQGEIRIRRLYYTMSTLTSVSRKSFASRFPISQLLTGDLDYHFVRASMVILFFFFFGYQK